jgi:3-oxoacyl-[acyl-carrier protein] reductase
MFKLDGKVALVTGGSRGIGRACCEALAEHGATVVVGYVKGEAQARKVADAIVAKGGKAEILGFDVADTKASEAAVDDVAKRLGRLDILVASAGIAIDGLLLRLREDEVDRLFQVNVKGALACAKAATKTMMRAKTGRIIFLSSVVGEMGNVGQTAYAATKAALLGAAKSIAREFASRNITVNAIAPGFIDTDMTSTMSDQMKAELVKIIPLGRTGTAREVAAACVYLASDEAAYVTGQVLRVNGGMYV